MDQTCQTLQVLKTNRTRRHQDVVNVGIGFLCESGKCSTSRQLSLGARSNSAATCKRKRAASGFFEQANNPDPHGNAHHAALWYLNLEVKRAYMSGRQVLTSTYRQQVQYIAAFTSNPDGPGTLSQCRHCAYACWAMYAPMMAPRSQ